jgi:transaldolase/glucose-6-phosphate isomerase
MLRTLEQSIWVDAPDQDALDSGTLQRLIDDDDISGACLRIGERAADRAHTPPIYGSRLRPPATVDEVQRAADLFRHCYDACSGADGYVSVESTSGFPAEPRHALIEARGLWEEIGRPNILIASPGVKLNLPVIRDLVAAGINVNVTRLYSGAQYREAFEAYAAGLETRLAQGHPVDRVVLVASFPVSAIDRQIDAAVAQLGSAGTPPRALTKIPPGAGGIAHATVLARRALTFTLSERFTALAKHGAQAPRLLWDFSRAEDTQSIARYVDALARVDTISNLPLSAIEDYRQNGVPPEKRSPMVVEQEFIDAMNTLIRLRKAGVDIDMIALQLQADEAARREPAAPESIALAPVAATTYFAGTGVAGAIDGTATEPQRGQNLPAA